MEEKQVSYDWAAYYQSAYEKEKKKNNILAAKLADEQLKREELKDNLERIEKSIFWKLSAPVRKCYYAFFSKNKSVNPIVEKITDAMINKDCIKEYQEEVFKQKHPYLQWIAENEVSQDISEIPDEAVVNGWKKIELDGTELCIILCGNGVLAKNAPEIIKSWFNKNRRCLFAYADEDYYWKDLSNRMHPWFKPCWSPDTMLSFCYAGHMIIVQKSLYHGLLEGDRYNTGSYSDFYDLCLLLEERAYTLEEGDKLVRSLQNKDKVIHDRIGNIEQVLFHNRYEPGEDAGKEVEEVEKADGDALEIVEKLLLKELEQGHYMTGCEASYCDMKDATLKRRGVRAYLETGADPDIYHVRYNIDRIRKEYSGKAKTGMVSVIIPSKDHPELLEQCLSSFRERTEYTNYEWIVVDNGSSPENKAKVEALQEEYGFAYIYEPMEFNFSAMCNLGVQNASGNYLLFLNDDIEIIHKDWLEIMLGQAMQPHTGAVGAKLWYAGSDMIQHVGITNMGVGPSHKLTSLIDDRCYYYGRNCLTYDMAGVTAACLMIDKKKYLEAGGMDESMKVAYNDVDLCFRLIEAGYYNVLRNDAVLYHHESMSRGLDQNDNNKWMRLLAEKEDLYSKHPAMSKRDPFYNSNLIDDSINYTCNFKCDHMKKDMLSQLAQADSETLSKAIPDQLHLVVDSIGEQQKNNRNDADVIAISGWNYIPGEDNARYTRSILLQKRGGNLYKVEPFPWYRSDVEKVLTNEVNVSLAGFVARFEKSKLKAGRWKIGMVAEDVERHRKYVAWVDERLLIE
ncbi:MAG: glycosyltransferase family 2 protein [Lachnospiraceae bacterium]|nr:glycosyltransferase family 2 protein [Lachnospiraceae bacterium]